MEQGTANEPTVTEEQGAEPPSRTQAAAGGTTSASTTLLARRMTSEMELLISGALIFSLLQLPDRLIGFALASFQRLSGGLGMVPFFLSYLGTLLAFLLTAGFVVHFLVRSFWVALRGLNNVFPGGIDWEELDAGPMSKQALRSVLPTPRQLEERADRVASTIFSVLFYLFSSLVSVFVVVAVLGASCWLVVTLLGLEIAPMTVLFVALGLLMVPLLFFTLVDAVYKRRPPDLESPSRLFRLGSRSIRLYQTLFGGRLYAPIALVFATRFSSMRTGIATSVSILALVGVFLLSFMTAAGLLGFDSYRFLPDVGGAGEVNAISYLDRRPADAPPSMRPTIQSAVIEGSYLELFVPFDVDDDTERLLRACPDLEPLRGEGLYRVSRRPLEEEEERQRLACLSRIYRVEIDGVPVTLDPVLSSDQTTGLRGLLAFVPVSSLAAGSHLLTVGRDVPRDSAEAGGEEDGEEGGEEVGEERDAVRIPFWR